MTPGRRRALRVAGGVAVLGVALAVTGLDAVAVGLRSLDALTVALAVALAVPATVACAWRWHLVARGLGVGIDLGPAVAACYRAQLLNTTLPGGVAGDVHRGVSHGRSVGHTGRGLRAVAWERLAGQVVLVVVTVPALLLLPSSPVPAVVPVLLGLVALGGAVWLAWSPAVAARGSSLVGRLGRAVREDLRVGLLVRDAWPGVVAASVVALACNLATYLVAARAVGVTASVVTLLPIALLVFVAAGLPTNLAGWGPREGMAAWLFGVGGLGADQGLATAVAFGVMVLVANLPGALVLLVAAGRAGGRRTPGGRRRLVVTGSRVDD